MANQLFYKRTIPMDEREYASKVESPDPVYGIGTMLYISNDHHSYFLPYKTDDPAYHADNFGPNAMTLSFIHMLPDGTYVPGITDEQLLQILIDRSKYFQEVLPCAENELALKGLEIALEAKQLRTRSRAAQKVEGTHYPHVS
jgi:hypothetical protein